MRKSVQTPLIVGGVSILMALLPILPTLIAAYIAKTNQCVLHEGFANPCVVLGVDIGSTLYTMGVSAWMLILTVPAGAFSLLVSIIWLFVALILANRK
ncbi:MAG: hypothetical protein HY273_10395 [Gammaproteobacteria bacterium]|nr:hypothetical protein [Gammaproteobacteria bacterium]